VDAQAQTVDEAAWRKHKLPKTLEEAMLMNRASVLLLSVPETDMDQGIGSGIPSMIARDQAEWESLMDCSITSIHIAEGKHRSKQRVVLSGNTASAFPGDGESQFNATHHDESPREESSYSRAALTQFGSIPFRIPAETVGDEVNIVFEKPFMDTRYAVTGNASVPGVTVSVTKRQRDSAVLTVERGHTDPAYEGFIMWIAMGHH
jgi:hypothetical protein